MPYAPWPAVPGSYRPRKIREMIARRRILYSFGGGIVVPPDATYFACMVKYTLDTGGSNFYTSARMRVA